MRRVLAEPLLSLALFASWLMLSGSLSPGHMVLGAALAIGVPWLTRRWRPDRPRLALGGAVLLLAATVLRDIVESNIAVARAILGDERRIKPRFVRVPLAIRDPHGVVALAGIVTMTPGTLSAHLSDDRTQLLLHAFDVDSDEAQSALVAHIRRRYEQPLMQIFEGARP